jgi:putative transposase
MRLDYVHMCIEAPPKYAVASVIGFIKGKSAIAIAWKFSGKKHSFTGEQFWARGYAVLTVRLEVETVRAYILLWSLVSLRPNDDRLWK